MKSQEENIGSLLNSLRERAKELNCLYQVEELTSKTNISIEEVLEKTVAIIPPGWQFPETCVARIIFEEKVFQSSEFRETQWLQEADILVQDKAVGRIQVFYTTEQPTADEGPFLKEERKLINTIAERLGHFILHQRLKDIFEQMQETQSGKNEWWVIMELLHNTDPHLLMRVSRKMTNYLGWRGVKESQQLLKYFHTFEAPEYMFGEVNFPHQKKTMENILLIGEEIFKTAAQHLPEGEIIACIQKWIKEERSSFLVDILENPGAPLSQLIDAFERYHNLDPQGLDLSEQREKGLRVSLVRRLLTDQPQFVSIAKKFFRLSDMYNLLKHVVYVGSGHGKLGGKSSGMLLATKILAKFLNEKKDLGGIKTPKTWYVTSDGLLSFLRYNNLEDVIEQKYKEIWQVREDYPYIVQVFKNSQFSPEYIKGLSTVLDDIGEKPLIVRSSSLLEDRMGTAFAGKYKSLFLANQGRKEERLSALMDAIAEVYASTFSPDPIEYRIERGLVDVHEEMGIMIQEVVGQRIGDYFFPAFAGVAFSSNEFRWSPRIKREDGLVRMVPGLGTRAVDRLSDDYPILIAPGQPGMRVNISIDEILHYAPKKIDVINVKTNSFETLDIRRLLKQCGDEYPAVHNIVSVLDHNHLRVSSSFGIDFDKDFLVVNFEGLISKTPFIKKIHEILQILERELDTPVDIEFASDGTDLYLLQCRPQSFGADTAPASLPGEVPSENIIFTASRYISNGLISNITHIVYVDPQKYSSIGNRETLLSVGRVIGLLNRVLPKRQYILMGPGRWGSRGDIKLGVSVTYSDINNTAMLIEIARQKGNYTPELSFGTHFFQDLVESGIRYLPLYPDQPQNVYKEKFLNESQNILADILPDFAALADTVRVIEVPALTGGLNLHVAMNAEYEKAYGYLAEPTQVKEMSVKRQQTYQAKRRSEDHWRWRHEMAEVIAAQLDAQRLNVVGMYLFGSTKNATAGPGSDIDLLVHFRGDEAQRKELTAWLEGWSMALAQMNYLRTGVTSDGLLDVHIITDKDIENRTSYAAKIGAITDPAQPLVLGKRSK